MHLTPDFTTPGHDSGLKYFIVCLLNSDIPFKFSHFSRMVLSESMEHFVGNFFHAIYIKIILFL